MKRTDSESEGRTEGRGNSADDRERTTSNVPSEPVASLHRSVGNQSTQRLHEAGALGRSLEVSHPGDRAEREAERVADEVLRSPGPDDGQHRDPSRLIETVGPRRGAPVQARRQSATGGADTGGPESRIGSLSGSGRSLPDGVRSEFEGKMGQDFGDVRVHTGAQADRAARSVEARAFTYGTDVVFRNGEYSPGTTTGKRLLAHELTHVVQQHGGTGGNEVQRQPEGRGSEDGGGGGFGTLGSLGETVSQRIERAGEAIYSAVQQAVEIVRKSEINKPGVIVTSTTAYETPPTKRGGGPEGGSRGQKGSGGKSQQENGSGGGSGSGSGGQSGGESLAEGTQVFVRGLRLVNGSRWYEVEVKKKSNAPVSRYVKPDSFMLWYGSTSTSPDEVQSKMEGGGSGGKNENPQPEAARKRMIRLAEEEWKENIEDVDLGDTHHDVDNGTIHVTKDLSGEVKPSDVAVASPSSDWRNTLADKYTVVVVRTNPDKDKEAFKRDAANLINIFSSTGASPVEPVKSAAIDNYDAESNEDWCGRFVGSLAAKAGVKKEVLKKPLWSTVRILVASREDEIEDSKLVPDMQPLKNVDGDPSPGDIVTVKQGDTPGAGAHITLAAGAPRNGYLPTIEGNGHGWHPTGEWTEGVVKRFRAMSGADGVKQIYRLKKEHFEGGGEGQRVHSKAKGIAEDVAGSKSKSEQ